MKDEMRRDKTGNFHTATKYSAHIIRDSGVVCAIERKMCG